MLWKVYMLRLRDGCIYVGSTNDLDRRFAEHLSGNGGKTTSDSPVIELIYTEANMDSSAARKRESQLKRWSRAKKLALSKGQPVQLRALAKSRD